MIHFLATVGHVVWSIFILVFVGFPLLMFLVGVFIDIVDGIVLVFTLIFRRGQS